MYNKVELCGVNTAELPILSEQEKRDLLTRARAGDKEARQSMIEGNLRLVLSVVQRFSQRGENMDDLFQVGCIGLIKAIDNFDPAQQVRFSTYGVPMIIGEIRRFLRDNNALRVSRSLRDTAYRAMQSREELEKQLGREPTVDEIAQKTGLSRREVSAALESVVEPLSLEEPVYADGGDAVYVIDQVRDPDGEDSWISGLQFRQTVAGLTPREKRIMELRYLKGKTQMEVAREIGISQAQVSRLEKAGLVDAALRCGVKPFSTLTALLCKAVRAYLDKDEVLYSYSTDARDALGAPNALYNCVASFQRKLPLTADAPLAEVAVGVDADLKENLSAERKLFRIAEQMGWVYRVYQQKASLSIKKRIFQMGEYISGFPADFWVSYLGDPFAPSSPELTRYIEDFQTWVPADGASIGLECTSLHGIITLCVKNKVPRPGFAEALRAAFEAEGIKVLEAAELGADNT